MYRGIVKCQECNVTLCAGYCYETFHSLWDINANKNQIKNNLHEDKDEKCQDLVQRMERLYLLN